MWETRVERLESGTGPPTRVLLILLISLQPSQVRHCNMSEPSRVNPCVIYYCHLPAPREEAWSQLHLLFFTLRAVLSVSVKRVKLIQEKKVSGLAFSSADVLISPLYARRCWTFAQKEWMRKFWHTNANDGGGEQGANHHVLRHRENHACQEALVPREPPETGLRRLGRAWSVFQGRITGICCWSLVSLSELQPLPLCFNQMIQIEAVEGSCVGLCLLQHHYPHFPPLSACAS